MCESSAVFVVGTVVSLAGLARIACEVVGIFKGLTRRQSIAGGGQQRDPKHEELLAMFAQSADESRRYRDYEWHMTVWAVTLLAAIVAVTLQPRPLTAIPVIPFLRAGVWLIIVAFTAHLVYAHAKLAQVRSLYETLAGKLGLGDFLQPSSHNLLRGSGHVASWIGLILIVGAAALYAVSNWN